SSGCGRNLCRKPPRAVVVAPGCRKIPRDGWKQTLTNPRELAGPCVRRRPLVIASQWPLKTRRDGRTPCSLRRWLGGLGPRATGGDVVNDESIAIYGGPRLARGGMPGTGR